MNIKEKIYSSVKNPKIKMLSSFIFYNTINTALLYLAFLLYLIAFHITTQPIVERAETTNLNNENKFFENYIGKVSKDHLFTTHILCKISPDMLNEIVFNRNDHIACHIMNIKHSKVFNDIVRGEK